MAKELVMYTRTFGCPYVSIARRVLEEHHIAYREVFIDQDEAARERVLTWTGFLSVPTLVVVESGMDVPDVQPPPLPTGSSPRGINRGVMITEPNADELLAWLGQHHFVKVHDNL